MTTAYKSNIIKLKMDKDPIQSRIYFIEFVESLEMIFTQYKYTCELLLDYPKIGGENIKYFIKNSMRNIFHANIDVRSSRFIAEFPGYRVKFIENFSHIVPTWLFLTKVGMTGFSTSHT